LQRRGMSSCRTGATSEKSSTEGLSAIGCVMGTAVNGENDLRIAAT
jgi:hypothetical protein